jgi:glycerol-3-phosphate acyltransferase PlsY
MTGVWGLLLAYLLGSLPAGYLLVRVSRGADVRAAGSGNIGATNVARVAGWRLGVLALLLDAGKAYLAVWLAGLISGGSAAWTSLAAPAAVAGNAWPVFLRFRGGKGMATLAGSILALAPVTAAAVIAVFAAVAVRTRYVSAGSVVAAASLPLGVWLIEHPSAIELGAAGAAAAIVLWRHRDNLRRLRTGAEPRFTIRERL